MTTSRSRRAAGSRSGPGWIVRHLPTLLAAVVGRSSPRRAISAGRSSSSTAITRGGLVRLVDRDARRPQSQGTSGSRPVGSSGFGGSGLARTLSPGSRAASVATPCIGVADGSVGGADRRTAAPPSASNLSRNESIGALSIAGRTGTLHGASRNANLQVKSWSCPQPVHDLWKLPSRVAPKMPNLQTLWKPRFQRPLDGRRAGRHGKPLCGTAVKPQLTSLQDEYFAAKPRIRGMSMVYARCQGRISS